MTKAPGYLNIAWISDIHLHHRKTPTGEIVQKLIDTFSINDPETAKLDMIVIVGDLFDSVMMYGEDDALQAELFMLTLLDTCQKLNIVLRVLEGTPMHDRQQSAHFEILNDQRSVPVDFRYVKRVEIEYISALGINMLYVPDEWRHDNDDTWVCIEEELTRHQLSKVDFVAMHGFFEYQVPEGLRLPHHREDRFLSITKYYISIGHDHRMSRYDRIFSQGSFDRLRHNEEEDKGHIRTLVRLGDDRTQDAIKFIVNKNAKRFVTLDLLTMSDKDLNSPIEKTSHFKTLEALPKGSHVRFRVNGEPKVSAYTECLKTLFPDMYFSEKGVSQKNGKVLERVTALPDFNPVAINERTIGELVVERMGDAYDRPVREGVVNLLSSLFETGR